MTPGELPFRSSLHHVGLIFPDAERLKGVATLLGLTLGEPYYVERYQAQCHFTTAPSGSAIEFVIPGGGKLAEFNKGMGGLHHVALQVEDLAAASAALRAQGVDLLEEEPVEAGALRINFVPPAWTWGVIVELVEVGG
ncbi:MAG: VOC family protein [Planctomycetota bacterium]